MAYLEELLPEFRKGAKIRNRDWEKEHYLYYDCEDIWNEDNELVSFSGKDLVCASWELYQEPIDWDYIIENKCLCWFWDKSTSKCIGLLKQYGRGQESFFVWQDEDENTACFDNCCPVRKDEVTFYEDKKDE